MVALQKPCDRARIVSCFELYEFLDRPSISIPQEYTVCQSYRYYVLRAPVNEIQIWNITKQ